MVGNNTEMISRLNMTSAMSNFKYRRLRKMVCNTVSSNSTQTVVELDLCTYTSLQHSRTTCIMSVFYSERTFLPFLSLEGESFSFRFFFFLSLLLGCVSVFCPSSPDSTPKGLQKYGIHSKHFKETSKLILCVNAVNQGEDCF